MAGCFRGSSFATEMALCLTMIAICLANAFPTEAAPNPMLSVPVIPVTQRALRSGQAQRVQLDQDKAAAHKPFRDVILSDMIASGLVGPPHRRGHRRHRNYRKKHRRPRRLQSAPFESSCSGNIRKVLIHDGLPTVHRATLMIGRDNETLAPVATNLTYGDVRTVESEVRIQDRFEVVLLAGETFTGTVSASSRSLSCEDHVVVVISQNDFGRLFVSLTIRQKMSFGQNATIVVYNALQIHFKIDVILFNRDLLRSMDKPALLRIGRRMTLNRVQLAVVSAGNYSIKVVQHKSIADHCQFQRVQSIVPERMISLSAGQQYYITLFGVANKKLFSPSFAISPKTVYRQPILPKVAFFVVNAYRSHSVTMTIPHLGIRETLHYANGTEWRLSLQEGDCYEVSSGTQTFVGLLGAVPRKDAVCIAVPDHDVDGSLTCYIHCDDENMFLPAPDHSELFTYHAMGNVNFNIDVLIFDEEAAREDGAGLYRVTSDLPSTYGDHSLVPASTYLVKAFQSGLVNNSFQFQHTKSVINPTMITFGHQESYYAVLMGMVGSISYPPSLIIYPNLTKASVTTLPFDKVPVFSKVSASASSTMQASTIATTKPHPAAMTSAASFLYLPLNVILGVCAMTFHNLLWY